MRLLDIRLQCHDNLFAQIDLLRGSMPQDQFVAHALAIGVGHLQEEAINQHRQQTYEALAFQTKNYGKATELLNFSQPSPSTPVVTAFGGQDVTPRPKVAS